MSERNTTPRPVDTQVGKTIRARRHALGMTQQELAALIGVKFQQVQKYETGTNRVSASRLYDIARALRCNIDALFDGIEGVTGQPDELLARGAEEAALLRAIRAMPEARRGAVLQMAEAIVVPAAEAA